MSLISSQIGEYKEDVLVNTDRWNVYYTELKKKNVHGAIGFVTGPNLSSV